MAEPENDIKLTSADSSTSPAEPQHSDLEKQAQIDRRDFLWLAGMGAGSLLATGCATVPAFQPAPQISSKFRGNGAGHIVVIGAGAWGSWTAYHLRQRGAKVTHIDAYGAGKSSTTSGRRCSRRASS